MSWSACSARASAWSASAASSGAASGISSECASSALVGVAALPLAGSVRSTTPEVRSEVGDPSVQHIIRCTPPPPLSLGPLLVCASSSLASYATNPNVPSIGCLNKGNDAGHRLMVLWMLLWMQHRYFTLLVDRCDARVVVSVIYHLQVVGTFLVCLPITPSASMDDAIAAAKAGQYRSAIQMFEAAISGPPCPHHQPSHPPSTLPASQQHAAHEMLAQCLMELDDLPHALHHARAAIALVPTYPPGLLTLGRAAAACGNFPEALDTLRTCVVCARSRAVTYTRSSSRSRSRGRQHTLPPSTNWQRWTQQASALWQHGCNCRASRYGSNQVGSRAAIRGQCLGNDTMQHVSQQAVSGAWAPWCGMQGSCCHAGSAASQTSGLGAGCWSWGRARGWLASWLLHVAHR